LYVIPKTTVTVEDFYTEVEINAMIGQALNLWDKASIALFMMQIVISVRYCL
jgi:hypothetical protein